MPGRPRCCSLASQTAPVGRSLPYADGRVAARQKRRANWSSESRRRSVHQRADGPPLVARERRVEDHVAQRRCGHRGHAVVRLHLMLSAGVLERHRDFTLRPRHPSDDVTQPDGRVEPVRNTAGKTVVAIGKPEDAIAGWSAFRIGFARSMRADRRARAETGPRDPPGRSPAVRGAPLRASRPHAPTAAKWRPTAWQSTAQRPNPIARRRVCSRQSLERDGALLRRMPFARCEPAGGPGCPDRKIPSLAAGSELGSDPGLTLARARATGSIRSGPRLPRHAALPRTRSEAYGPGRRHGPGLRGR